MSKLDTRTALIQGVITANVSNYPVKWPNAEFDTPNNTIFVAADLLTMDDEPVTNGIGGYNRVFGVLQLSVYAPSGSSDVGALSAVDELENTFKTGAKLTHNGVVVRILSASSRQGPQESSWYSQIISVEYETYLMRT